MNQPVKPMEFKFTEDSIIKGHYHSVMPERVWKDLDQDFHNRAIHVIEKSYADKLQSELKAKDELLEEFIDVASDVVGMEMRTYGRLSNTSGLGSSISILNSFIEKLCEGNK